MDKRIDMIRYTYTHKEGERAWDRDRMKGKTVKGW